MNGDDVGVGKLETTIRASRRMNPWLRAGAGAVLILAIGWFGYHLSWQRGLYQLHQAAQQRLEVEATRLDGQLARFEYLPSLLETSPDVRRLLDEPANAALGLAVSRYLGVLNALAGADNLYVVQRSGMTLAAADFDRPGTPVGQDLSYRPYVREALASGHGQFYGIGITSSRAGFYLSYAIPAKGPASGVATVKVNLEAFEREWRELPGEFLLVDDNQVVILSSNERWKYHPIAPLSDAARREAAEARRYGASDLSPLDWVATERIDARAEQLKIDGRDRLGSDRPVNRGQWRLILLSDEGAAHAGARNVGIAAGLGAAVLLLAATLAAQRRRLIRQRLANRAALQAANDTLETKVQERTAELRAAQAELVHAGKLAALGQMSAGIVHELNQPLAAMHTLSDNAVVLLDRNQHEDVRGNLVRITALIGRLARMTRQLKVFAYKSGDSAHWISLQKAVHETLSLLEGRLRQENIDLTVQITPANVQVSGDEARLEQVLANLIGNAIDAVSGAPIRRIDITAIRREALCMITIRNSGPNIAPHVLPRLFEPFVTTKPPGQGLGLGLMITSHIIGSFGGRIEANNLPDEGVEFIVELPCNANGYETVQAEAKETA